MSLAEHQVRSARRREWEVQRMSLFRAGVLGSGLLLAATGATAEVVERDFHRTFDVESGDRLHLEHGDGDVFIEPWDQDKLDVEVRYRVEYTRIGVGSKLDFDVEFRQTGSTVHVLGRESGQWSIGFFAKRESEHRYTIRAPAYLLLDVDGEDGDVEVSGWQGEIAIRTDDGDLDLTDIRSARTDLSGEDGDIVIDGLSGELTVSADDGDLRISDCTISDGRVRLEDGDAILTRCTGSARFELEDGDLTLEEFRPERLAVRTQDGDVELDLVAGSVMDVDVRTVDGDITVDLAPGCSVRFTIDTADGPIRLEAPGAVDVKQRRRSVSGQLGAGEGRLRIESEDGRVLMRERS